MNAVAQPGATLKDGRYQIEVLLRAAPGKDVYRARDNALDCAVVVDAIPFEAVATWEARLLGRLGDHPNIASVIDTWQDDESSYIVTRYLPGGSLQDLIDAAQAGGDVVPVDRIFTLAVQLARALDHIHGRRILYRDLQPRNILFDAWGAPHLVDFDTAISLDDPDAPAISDGRSTDHMAPEVAAGESADERADLYSLGTTIRAMCDGDAGRASGKTTRSQSGQPGLRRSDIPEGLTTLLSELLAPRREDRPASALEVVQRLGDIVTAEEELEDFLAQDESATLEFRSSLRTSIGPRDPADVGKADAELRKTLELGVLTTIAAFLNTRGGTLVIGVDEAKAVVGIEVDFPHTMQSREGWRHAFDDLTSHGLGPAALESIDLQLAPYRGKTIALVRCQPREEPTWIEQDLFMRGPTGTEKLTARQAWGFFRERLGSGN
jgi:serine/threonine protein kinase